MTQSLLEGAAGIMALVSIGLGVLRSEADQRRTALEREVIGAAARGRLQLADLQAVPSDAWTDPARELAALAARVALRATGRRTSFFAVRLALVRVPRFVDLETFAELLRSASDELDAAEDTDGNPAALELLLADVRARACLAELRPVLAALDRGEPLRGTGELLRQAADAFEGPRPRRRVAA